MTLLENIESLMDASGIKTKAALAKFTGLPYTTVDGFWKKGTENIRLKTVKKISSAFCCTLDYLVYGKDGQSADISALYTKLLKNERAMDAVQKFLQMDAADQIRIAERIDMLLEDPKYEEKRKSDIAT